jgi:hypothetical protein
VIESPSESVIVTIYEAGNPNRQNSRELVAEIAAKHGLTVGKVRSVLVKAGVYISLPKDKSKIDQRDLDELLSAFHKHAAENGINDDYFGPDDLMTGLSERVGYGKWALGELYREWNELDRPRNARQLQKYRDAKQKNAQRAWDANIEKAVSRSRSLRATRRSLSGKVDNQYGVLQPAANLVAGFVNLWSIVVFVFIVAMIILWLKAAIGDDDTTSLANDTNAAGSSVQGTATADEREIYSLDQAPNAPGMNSEQREQYEQMSSEGKEYVDRQMEAYDAMCAGSSEC